MEIRFDCECYERTLVITVPTKYRHLREEILQDLDRYYDEWICFETEEAEAMCLEEYMVKCFSEEYDLCIKWDVEEW
jgi:hypothetical protein